MKLLHNLSFKRKLMVLTLVTTTIALLLAGVVLVAYEVRTFHESIVNDVSAQAKILANLSSAQLSFNDSQAATEMLHELRHEPYIVAAVLFDAGGRVFATYQRDPAHPFEMPKSVPVEDGHDLTAGHLFLHRTVQLNGQSIGTVCIVSDMRQLYSRLRQYLGIVLGALLASVLLALWFSSVLQRAISQPILELSGTARVIAAKKDFSLRAARFGNDEIGLFTDAFNQMLVQIQAQDGALQAAHQQLAGQVEALQREIEERRRVEAALQTSEERFRSLFENAPVGIYRSTPEGRVQLANPALLRMLGFPCLAELVAWDLNTEGFAAEGARQDFVERLERDGELKAYESTWRRKDGTPILVSEYARVVRAPDGQTMFYEGTVEDITERKRNETRKTTFSMLGQALSAATDAKAAARAIVEVADSLLGWDACTLDLYSAEEDKAYALVNIDLVEDQRVDVAAAYTAQPPTARARRILTQGAELILREPPYTAEPDSAPFGDRSRPSASLMYVPVRDGAKVIGVLSIQSYRPKAYGPADLETLQALADQCGGALERIRMEENLRQSQQKFEALVNSISGIVWERSPDTFQFTFVSRQSELLLGYPPELWLANPRFWQEKLHPDDVLAALQTSQNAVAAGQPYHFDYRMVAADGRVVWIRESGVVLAEQGRPLAVRGIFQDITAQKRAAEALRESETKFRGLVETSPVGILIHEGGQFRYVNAVFQALTGYTQDELLALNFWEVIHPDFRELVQERGRARLRGEAPPGHYEFKTLMKSGGERWIEMKATRIEFEGRPAVLATFSDISERKQAEERLELAHRQLQDASHKAGMAEVATGVLHNVGNVLNSVNVSCTLAIDCVGQSRVSSLPKLAAMFEQHSGQLAEFLTHDPKGKQIPD